MGKRYKRAGIKAVSSHLPKKKLDNEQLAKEYPEWGIDKIFAKTGIEVRSIADASECASDLGVMAGKKLFETGVCHPEDVDFLLFCTQSPDYFLPTSACIMQERLGLRNSCGALDFNLGCSGFVYGLALAKGLIEDDMASNILLITAETYSKFIHPTDRTNKTIFSDGAAATLISAFDSAEELIGPFIFGTDGKGAQKLIVPAGALRRPNGPETTVEKDDGTGIFRSPQNLFMDGPEILNFTLKTVPSVVEQLIEKLQITLDDVDFFIFHQANSYMLESLRKKIRIPKQKFCINMASYGNTVSATIPMALELALTQGLVRKDNKVLLAGFGVGYSWASTMIRII